jgi:hypothetical protein
LISTQPPSLRSTHAVKISGHDYTGRNLLEFRDTRQVLSGSAILAVLNSPVAEQFHDALPRYSLELPTDRNANA